MAEPNSERTRRLVCDPAESLNVELKAWIDPAISESQGKIHKGVMALRNRNGGCFIRGFKDKSFQSYPNAPSDVRGMFKLDKLQQLVTKHSSEPFEMSSEFVLRSGQEYPVLIIPAGV